MTTFLQSSLSSPAGQVWKNFILVRGQRVAMREYTSTNPTGTVYFLLGDHLGSTSVVVNASTGNASPIRYSAYGEERFTSGTIPTNYRYTGQLSKVATVGLYHYGSRWMDPALAHFTQADSIVPGAGNPKAWDRYAGMLYNHVRYTDPTGHATTPAKWSEPQDCMLFSCVYNVLFTGKWTYKNMMAAVEAVKTVGAKFAEIIGGTAASAFNSVYGRITFGLDSGLKDAGFFGQTIGHVINFQPGIQITPRLVTHELGHAFEQRIYENNGNRYEGTNNPIEVLIHKGVWDKDGELITGTTNNKNPYLRYGNTSGSPIDNGYTSNDYHTEAQWHPKNMMPDGNTAGEDWADIFMNWTFGTFAPGSAGTALNNWTTTNMAGWISEARR